MPVQLAYPGVYIQEVPSGVRTITGVATSITAFVGRADRGDLNTPVTIFSFADYERSFGGLSQLSPMSFAVRDFFLNGGTQAIIVRLFAVKTPATEHPGDSPYTAQVNFSTDLVLMAASPGIWGTNLRATVDNDVTQAAADAISTPSTTIVKGDLFNLTVQDKQSGAVEVWRNLTFKDSSRRADKVLQAGSKLVVWSKPTIVSPGTTPAWLGALTKPRLDDTGAAEKQYSDDKQAGASSATLATDLTNIQTAITAMQGDDGVALAATNFTATSPPKTGIYALDDADLFNLLVIPPYTSTPRNAASDVTWETDVEQTVMAAAATYCEKRRAILLADPPTTWDSTSNAQTGGTDFGASLGTNSKNAAVFFPRLSQPNPFHNNQFEDFVPSGAVAGVMARTDAQRGVWKAPAGLDATLNNVTALGLALTDDENGLLNPLGLNCLRTIVPAGRIVWGSRTLQGDDRIASEWKYIPVRRTALFIEESVFRGTKWVVFEPNDEPLWSQIRLNVGAFMHSLFIQGAFQGQSPRDAFFVKCDSTTTTQDDINRGIVNIAIGFAPLKPAEFVVISLQQMAGQIAA